MIQIVAKQIVFDFKTLLKEKLIMLLLLLSPFLILILGVTMLTVVDAGNWYFWLSTSVVSLLVLFSIKFIYRKSTLYENNKLSNVGTLPYYISAYIFYTLIFIISSLLFMSAFAMYGYVFDIFMENSVFDSGNDLVFLLFTNHFSTWAWFITLYSLLNFSVFVILSRFFTEIKPVVSILLIYVVISLLFGGIINNNVYTYTLTPTGEDPFHSMQHQGEELFYIDLSFLYIREDEVKMGLSWVGLFVFPWTGINNLFEAIVINNLAPRFRGGQDEYWIQHVELFTGHILDYDLWNAKANGYLSEGQRDVFYMLSLYFWQPFVYGAILYTIPTLDKVLRKGKSS